MALTFGGVSTTVVNCGSGANLDQLDPWTFVAWVFPTTLTAGRFIAQKGANATNNERIHISLVDTGGNIRVRARRNGVNGAFVYDTNSAPLTLNAWNFLAVTFDSSNAANNIVKLYSGTLTSLLTAATFGTTTDSTGAFADDSAADLRLGASAAGAPLQGRIGSVQLFNIEMTQAELQRLQFGRMPTVNRLAYWELGYNGTSTQPDWSGNGNAGTVTDATASAHPPLSSAFASPFGAPQFSSAASLGGPLIRGGRLVGAPLIRGRLAA